MCQATELGYRYGRKFQTWEYMRHLRPENMLVTRIIIIQNNLKYLETETETQIPIPYKGIDYTRNLIHNKHKTYQSLVENTHPKLFMAYTDQNFTLKNGTIPHISIDLP